MKQDAFLQRRQRVDVLNIGRAAGNSFDDLCDFLGCELYQRQHVGGDGFAVLGNAVGRDIDFIAAGFYRGRQIRDRRRGKQAADIGR